MLPLLPSLRWLDVQQSGEAVILPHPSLFDFSNPFRSLERVSIKHLCAGYFEYLLATLQSAASTGTLRLTHFKLSLYDEGSMLEEWILGLIDALAGAPLQSLALGSVRFTGVRVLNRIAETFPDLCALTLNYYVHFRTKELAWPNSTLEYAKSLRGFNRLEYFAWNLHRRAVAYDTAPEVLSGMTPIAEGIADEPENNARTVSKVCATHCPTLKSIVFLDVARGVDICCDVDALLRGSDDAVQRIRQENAPANFGMYDPCWSSESSWPVFDKRLLLKPSIGRFKRPPFNLSRL